LFGWERELIYVGITGRNLGGRVSAHKQKPWRWCYFIRVSDENLRSLIERFLVKAYQPKLNRNLRKPDGFYSTEP
jgi:hypothetical protein